LSPRIGDQCLGRGSKLAPIEPHHLIFSLWASPPPSIMLISVAGRGGIGRTAWNDPEFFAATLAISHIGICRDCPRPESGPSTPWFFGPQRDKPVGSESEPFDSIKRSQILKPAVFNKKCYGIVAAMFSPFEKAWAITSRPLTFFNQG